MDLKKTTTGSEKKSRNRMAEEGVSQAMERKGTLRVLPKF